MQGEIASATLQSFLAALDFCAGPQGTEIDEREVKSRQLNQVDGQISGYSQTTSTCGRLPS
jgi:hypothetical protein